MIKNIIDNNKNVDVNADKMNNSKNIAEEIILK